MKKTLVISFIIFLIIACATKNGVLKYKTLKLEENIPLIDGDPDSIGYHVEFKYTNLLDYKNKQVLRKIKNEYDKQFFNLSMNELKDDPFKNFKQLIDSIAQAYRNEVIPLKKDFGELGYLLNYELIKSSKIIYNKNKLLFVEIETYIFTGGAHGVSNKQYLHFNMNTGKLFGSKDLFSEQGQDIIRKLLQNKCAEMKKSGEVMFFEEVKPEISDNFYFDENKLYFVYNPYEIAPYSFGYIEIDIPIKNFKNWINKNGPLAFFNKN